MRSWEQLDDAVQVLSSLISSETLEDYLITGTPNTGSTPTTCGEKLGK